MKVNILLKKTNRVVAVMVCALFLLMMMGTAASASEDINLIINGEKIVPDVPPIIRDGRVLLPVRIVAESLGVQVDYNSSTKEITLTRGSDKILLTVNKQEAYLNGELRLLDVPAAVINGRTLVPVRFVSEALGSMVEWQGETRTVIVSSYNQFLGVEAVDAGLDENLITYQIKTTRPVRYEIFTLADPNRLIIDMEDLLMATKNLNVLQTDLERLAEIRWSQFNNNPLVTRVVFEGKAAFNYEITQDQSGQLLVTFDITPSSVANKVIVVDPGHGGTDPGAISANGLRESELALKVALALAKLLEQEGAKVILTRDADYFVGLYDRAELANEAKADIFVSIHANAAPNATARGTETFYHHTPKDWRSAILAQMLQQAVLENLLTQNRGVKQANFVVIRETNMASALVELAFLTNKEDEALLSQPNLPSRAAEALLSGIKAYFEQAEVNSPREVGESRQEGETS